MTHEASVEEDAHRDLLLFMELLMNLLSKDLMDLSPYATENAPVTFGGLPARIEPVDAANELLRFPSLCSQYFKLITFACEICPNKMDSLPPVLLSNLFASLQLGLTVFGPDIATQCFDFIQLLATHLVKSDLFASPAHQVMKSFLKIVLEMIISQQVSSDVLNKASGTFYALVCAYQADYQQLVEMLLMRQVPSVAIDWSAP